MNQDLMDVESDSDLNNSDSDDGADDEDDKLLSDSDSEAEGKATKAKLISTSGKDVESSGSSDDEGDKNNFINPLSMLNKKKQKKVEGEVSEGEWSDESGEGKTRGKGSKKNDKKALGKRGNKDRDLEDDKAKDFYGKSTFEEVPNNDMDEKTAQDNEESLDSHEIAETRILAKKMLRKKQRTELLDATYNRYSFHEPNFELPNWFVTDE